MTRPQLLRLRLGVRATLALALAVSLAANVLHADSDPISRAISAWPPIALMLAAELISRIPATSRAMSVARLVATAIIAAIAAWVSYWHMAAVAKAYGEHAYGSEYLWPLTVDGLAIVASICLVELGGRLATAADEAVATPPAPASTTVDMPVDTGSDLANSQAAWPDPWQYALPVQEGGQREVVVATAAPDVDTEVASWMASTGGQRELQVAKAKVATAKRPVATYDQAAARTLIRDLLAKETPASEIDDRVASEHNVSTRTARRLRGQVAGEPVSGPPSDVQDGER